MRIASLLTLMVSAVLLVGFGCAAPRSASVPPTLEELPRIEHAERVLPVAVGVEGRADQPSVMLVPSFEEPELTPEELIALGKGVDPFDWLEFYVPLPDVQRVGTGIGGVATGIRGIGGAGVGLSRFKSPFAIGPRSSPIQGIHWGPDHRYGYAGRRAAAGMRGPGVGMQVGENPPRHVASHQDKPEQ